MFRNKTLSEDLEIFIMKRKEDVKQKDVFRRYILSRDDEHINVALKMIDDIHGKPVIYSDRDFIAARAPKSPIHKLLVTHKKNIPKQFFDQRKSVTNQHLDGVIRGTQQEMTYADRSELKM